MPHISDEREELSLKVYHGHIVSCDEKNTVYQYLAEEDGKIAFLGNDLPIKYKVAPQVELKDRALLPAFGDTHLHFSSFAFFASTVDVRGAKTHDELCQMIRDYDNRAHPRMIAGFGASANCVQEGTLITRTELDRVCPDRPVMIAKYDGHACVINTKLMQMLPAGTSKLRGFGAESGEMNQEAFFAVSGYVTSKIPALGLVRSMQRGYDKLAESGIGLIHTVEGVGFPHDMDVDMVRFLARGQRNPFPTRVFFQTMDVNKVLKRKLPRVGGCFATALDGCFGSEDAAMLRPFETDPENCGVLYYSDETVRNFCIAANRAGLQIEMHAIGDRAFVQALDALEAALKDTPREDHRHTIIHACLPTDEGLERMAKLGIGVALQPSFLDWEQEPFSYLERVMGERAARISPLRTMQQLGIHMSGGSDAPCTMPDPVEGLYAACNHFTPAQSLTIPEALRMFTYEAARMSFDEGERGTLEVGKIADMTILNRDPLSLDPKDLKQLKAEKLILSGNDYVPGQSFGSLLWDGCRGTNKAPDYSRK